MPVCNVPAALGALDGWMSESASGIRPTLFMPGGPKQIRSRKLSRRSVATRVNNDVGGIETYRAIEQARSEIQGPGGIHVNLRGNNGRRFNAVPSSLKTIDLCDHPTGKPGWSR